MEAVKDETPEEEYGLAREEMRAGNIYKDENGKPQLWELKDYLATKHEDGFRHEYCEGIDFTYKLCKELGFKFRIDGDGNKTGYLHVKAGHEYLWRPNEPLRLRIKSMLFVDSQFSEHVLNGLKDRGTDETKLAEIREELGAEQAEARSVVLTKLEQVHELQNAMFYLYGEVLDVSALLK